MEKFPYLPQGGSKPRWPQFQVGVEIGRGLLLILRFMISKPTVNEGHRRLKKHMAALIQGCHSVANPWREYRNGWR